MSRHGNFKSRNTVELAIASGMNSRDLSVQTTRLVAVELNRAERVSLGRPAELRHIPV